MNQHFGLKYLLSPQHAPDTKLVAWGTSVNKTDPCFCGTHILLSCKVIKIKIDGLLIFLF